MTWFRRHLLLAKLAALALVAVPVAAATAGHGGGGPALDVRWDAGRAGAPLRGTLLAPASTGGSHVTLVGAMDGDLALARSLRVVVYRRSDGARLYQGSLAGLAGLDVGATPQAPAQRELGYVVTSPRPVTTGSLRASFRWGS